MNIHRWLIIALFFTQIFLSAAGASAEFSDGNFIPPESLLEKGQVRAEIAGTVSDLLGGPKIEGRAGDFKLYNSRVGFIVSGVRPESGYGYYSGEVEEAGIIATDGGRPRWRNLMGNVFLIFFKGEDPVMDSRLFEPVKAEILKDGSDGEAVVRIYGRDAEFPVRKDILLRPSKPLKLKIIVDYILRPDSNALETRVSVPNDGEKNLNLSVGLILMLGDRAELFTPGYGYKTESMKNRDVELVGGGGAAGVSYGWFVKGGDVRLMDQFDVLTYARMGKIKVEAGQEGALSFFTAAAPDIAAVYEEKYRIDGNEKTGIISGRCMTRGSGAPALGAIVHVLSPDGKYLNQAIVRPDGSFRLAMQPGEYVLQAAAFERDDAAPVGLHLESGAEAHVEIEIDAPAILDYEVRDADGDLMPAMVSFLALDQKPSVLADVRFGRDVYAQISYASQSMFYENRFTKDGKGMFEMRPGKYQIYFSRGVEYEVAVKTVSLESGATVKEKVTLERVVETAGNLSGDFHCHSIYSHDADDSVQDRLIGAVAQGIEILVSTDHDRIVDYGPYVRELELERYVSTIVGDEVTTKRLGHFNGYPLKVVSEKRNEGAPESVDIKFDGLFKSIRDENPGARVIVQANHPRSKIDGYFDLSGFNPETGAAARKENFSLDFDVVEVLNGHTYAAMEQAVRDWYSLLNRGKRVTGVGNSDSHSVYTADVGYPRNFVDLNTDDPSELNEMEFVKAILGQRVVVCGGPYIKFDIDGKAGPGGLVSAPGRDVKLNIEISAPSWIGVDTFTVVANGEIINSIPLYDEDTTVRYKGTITERPEKDTWYVIRADGSTPLVPVYPDARAFSITNPIYVDADGNGRFDPPISQ